MWKAPMPSDFAQFYRNNLCEFRKHREIRLDAMLLKNKSNILDDIQFSMDDFLIIECRVQGGFIFEEIERPEEDEKFTDNIEGSSKSELLDPTNLEFANYDLKNLIKKTSNAGLQGLSNLGNTCFMNSALQCMSNSIELTKYFLIGCYKNEINYSNPLGTKGRLATAYAKLMKELWVTSDARVAPWDVKKAIGTVAYQFQGFAQQDSFELFNYVTDTLHEDLNRVKEKPYTEFKDSDGRPDKEVSDDHWSAFTDRNQSVIVDLMYGQLKSRLICSVCSSVSNTFDPYLALSLPIPKNKCSKINIVYFPCQFSEGKKIMRMKMNFENGDTIHDLKRKLQEQFDTENDMIVYSFQKRYLVDTKIEDEKTLGSLEDEAKLAVYEYDVEKKKGLCIIPASITKESRSMFGSSNYEDVCEQMVFLVDLNDTISDLRRLIFKRMFPLLILPQQYQEKYEEMKNKDKAIKMIYENMYLKADFGDNKMLQFQYEKEKS